MNTIKKPYSRPSVGPISIPKTVRGLLASFSNVSSEIDADWIVNDLEEQGEWG